MRLKVIAKLLIVLCLIIAGESTFAPAEGLQKKSGVIWKKLNENPVNKNSNKTARNIFEKYVEPQKPVKPLPPPPPPDPLVLRRKEIDKDISQYIVSGYLHMDGMVTLFLTKGSQNLTVKRGGYIENKYLVEKINGNEIILFEKQNKDKIVVNVNKNGTLSVRSVEFGKNENLQEKK